MKAYVRTAIETYGRIDCFFNNAGIEGKVAATAEYDEAVFDAVIGVNLKGVFLGLRHVLPEMIRQGSGAVVNTASVAGLVGTPGMPAYVASKHAVIGLTKTAAGEVARQGIRVNAVCPGPVDTRMIHALEEQISPGNAASVERALPGRDTERALHDPGRDRQHGAVPVLRPRRQHDRRTIRRRRRAYLDGWRGDQSGGAVSRPAGVRVFQLNDRRRHFGGRMALLVIKLDKIGSAQEWRDTFRQQIPDLPIRIWPDAGEVRDIEYLAFMHPDFDALPAFPNLKAMFSRAAGVDDIVRHPKLPKVPLGKVEPPGGDPMMTEYVVMHVLRLHRDMPAYQAAQANREWRRAPIVRPEQRRVGFLGFGMMAKAPALILKSLGFEVSAWVRSPRQAAEVPIFHGRDQLEPFLNQTDIAVCLLPLTAETEGIFCARTFAMMPRGAMLVNVGRGRHVVDKDLIAALDSGTVVLRRIGRAVARAAAAGESALAASQSDRDAARGAAADRRPAGHRNGREHQKSRGRGTASGRSRPRTGVLIDLPVASDFRKRFA